MFVHFSCICILSFLSNCSVCDVFLSLSLSLSLSRIDCTRHLSTNPLWLRTFLVLGLLLLIFPFPLFTFSSMMGRPNRTSLRTFKEVAFIWSAILFCWTFSTLLSPVSFRLRTGNLFVRYPWGHVYTGILLQHTQHRYLCTLVCHDISRYTYHSYPRSYIWGTTCSEGIASWLPRLWSSLNCVQRRASVSLLWDTFHIGWEAKHPMLGLCKRSEIP